jgi:predicted solute-binding protein
MNLRRLDDLIAEEGEFTREFCRRYFGHHLRFSFGEGEKDGLRAFAELCAQHDLIPKRTLALNLI